MYSSSSWTPALGHAPKWLEADTHNYAHLLQVTVPPHPAPLAVKATWAAAAAPFQPLTAEQLRRAAASDEGAHRVADLLLQRWLPAETARAPFSQVCAKASRDVLATPVAPTFVSSVFVRLLSAMPLRLLVILLGRLLPLLQSTAVPGVPTASLPLRALCTPWPDLLRRALLPCPVC